MPDTVAAVGRSLDRDYRREFARVRAFFPGGDPRDATVVLPQRAEAVQCYLSEDTLAGLREHNDALSCGDVTLGNIDLLDHDDVRVILATHEPCFLTGTLGVIYKAITCIQLAAYCRETLGVRAIPVFWLASDSVQTRTARDVRFVNAENHVIALSYEPDNLNPHGRLGDVPMDPQADFLLRMLGRDTANTDYKRYLIDLLLDTRERSRTLGEWTARLLHALFHIYGLVVVDETQPYASAQIVRCLAEPFSWGTRPARLLSEMRTMLEAEQYGGMIDVAPTRAPFAFRDDDGIEHWDVDGQRFESTRGRTLTAEDIRTELARRQAEVHLAEWIRPLVQANWLPVIGAVADPHEIYVAAHLGKLYEVAGLPAPLVYPRARVVLVERHVQRLLTKYNLTLADFVHGRKILTEKTLAKDIPRSVIRACDRKQDVIQAVLDELREQVRLSNPEFTGEVDALKRSLGHGLEQLRRGLIDAKTESPLVVTAGLESVRAHLFPEGKPQERLLNVFPFLFAHGIQLISKLSTELDVFDFGIQTIRL